MVSDKPIIKITKLSTLTGHKDSLYSMERDKNGKFVYSAGGDGGILQWDISNPKRAVLITQLEGSVYCMHRINDSLLAIGENNFGVRVLDIRKRKEVKFISFPKRQLFDITSLGDNMFVADGNGDVTVVDTSSWKTIDTIKLSSKRARCMAIDFENNQMAIGYSDNHIRIISLKDSSVLNDWKAHEKSVFSLNFLPGGEWLMSGGMDAYIKLWKNNSDFAPGGEIVGHTFAINHIDISPNGKYFLSCSMDKTIKVWDLRAGRLLKVIDEPRYQGHSASINTVKWLNDNTFVSAGDDKNLNIWGIEGI